VTIFFLFLWPFPRLGRAYHSSLTFSLPGRSDRDFPSPLDDEEGLPPFLVQVRAVSPSLYVRRPFISSCFEKRVPPPPFLLPQDDASMTSFEFSFPFPFYLGNEETILPGRGNAEDGSLSPPFFLLQHKATDYPSRNVPIFSLSSST